MVFLFIQNFFKRGLHTIKRHALVFLARLELWVSTSKRFHFPKSLCQAFKYVLQSPRVGDIPMLILLKFLELRQMLGHFGIRQRFPIPAVISHGKRNEVVTHNPYDIQVIVQVAQLLIVKKFVCRVSHGIPCTGFPLSPTKWEVDTLPSGNASYVYQHDTLIILQFQMKNKSF